MSVPTRTSIAIACTATSCSNAPTGRSPIAATTIGAKAGPSCRPCASPMTMGVPTAPNETGLLLATSASTTAAIGESPIATRSGAVIAAGVPKPATPSRKAPNSQAMITTCTRGSGVMRMKPARMTSIAPLAVSVLSRRIAPKTIQRMDAAIHKPSKTAATT